MPSRRRALYQVPGARCTEGGQEFAVAAQNVKDYWSTRPARGIHLPWRIPGPSQAGQANSNSWAVAIEDALFICWGDLTRPHLLRPETDNAF